MIKGNDILILLKIVANNNCGVKQTTNQMAEDFGLSQGEVSKSLNRCRQAGLLHYEQKNTMDLKRLYNFLLHGLSVIFPDKGGLVPFYKVSLLDYLDLENEEDFYLHELLSLIDLIRMGVTDEVDSEIDDLRETPQMLLSVRLGLEEELKAKRKELIRKRTELKKMKYEL